MTSHPATMTAAELAAAIRARQLSCHELMLATLAQIERMTMGAASVRRRSDSVRLGLVALVLSLSVFACASQAAAASLELQGRNQNLTLDSSALTALAEARDIEIPHDVSYQRATRYRAVPLARVLRQLGLQESDTLEVVALDGFVAQIPGSLVLRQQAPPWLAIEEEGAPWPALPRKSSSAGPFYIVWPDATGVASEQWPYAVGRLKIQQAPELRWPQLAVSASLAPDDPARRGQAVFIVQCLACHRMNGGGMAQVGPDLNLPANPTEYFQPQALRRLIRAPESLRSWPGQSMPAFTTDTLSDTALDDLLAYLEHMPQRREATR